MNAFDRSTAILHSTLRKHAGRNARYTRGASSTSVKVIPCRSDIEMIAGDTDSVTASSDDFTIAVADLKFGATAITPTAGDRITIDGTIYEVMNMAIDGAWRYADSTNSEYRIHSRRVTA